jgi:hypothetical protein
MTLQLGGAEKGFELKRRKPARARAGFPKRLMGFEPATFGL